MDIKKLLEDQLLKKHENAVKITQELIAQGNFMGASNTMLDAMIWQKNQEFVKEFGDTLANLTNNTLTGDILTDLNILSEIKNQLLQNVSAIAGNPSVQSTAKNHAWLEQYAFCERIHQQWLDDRLKTLGG